MDEVVGLASGSVYVGLLETCEGDDTVIGVRLYSGQLSKNHRNVCNNCYFSKGLDYGWYVDRGDRHIISNSHFDSDTAVRFYSLDSAPTDITLDNVSSTAQTYIEAVVAGTASPIILDAR